MTDILAEFILPLKNDTRKNQVEAAQNAVDYTRKLLLAGDDYTEVLTAEESYLSSQLAQVGDKLQQIYARYACTAHSEWNKIIVIIK